MAVQTNIGVSSPGNPPTNQNHYTTAGRWAIGGVLFVLICQIWHLFQDKPPRESVSAEELRLTAVRLNGMWLEDDELAGKDAGAWHGSAFVVDKKNGELVLVTNSHCLGLADLANADNLSDSAPDVESYGLEITFPSGKKRKALRIAETTDRLDIAMIMVAAEGLNDGVDYIPISVVKHTECKTGDTVVAIGTPLDAYFEGTQTYGRVSALRSHAPTGEAAQVIQHDAAINPGNSGGPLFLERKGAYYPLAVNTWSSPGHGLYMSISMSEITKHPFFYSAADADGVVEMIQRLYHRKCHRFRP